MLILSLLCSCHLQVLEKSCFKIYQDFLFCTSKQNKTKCKIKRKTILLPSLHVKRQSNVCLCVSEHVSILLSPISLSLFLYVLSLSISLSLSFFLFLSLPLNLTHPISRFLCISPSPYFHHFTTFSMF